MLAHPTTFSLAAAFSSSLLLYSSPGKASPPALCHRNAAISLNKHVQKATSLPAATRRSSITTRMSPCHVSNSHSLLNSTIWFYDHQPRGNTWPYGTVTLGKTSCLRDEAPNGGLHDHKYINNLTGLTIMGDVEPNVQRHVKTQLENSRLVCILLWSREEDKVM